MRVETKLPIHRNEKKKIKYDHGPQETKQEDLFDYAPTEPQNPDPTPEFIFQDFVNHGTGIHYKNCLGGIGTH
jgi:hypothetical protein